MGSSPDRVVRGGPAAIRGGLRGTIVHDAWRFATSLVDAARFRPALRDVRTYLLFIGHGRSGHSIVGSLLDAHPEAIVSDELDAARFIDRGFTRDQVLALSVARSARQAAGERRKAGRGGRTYSYLVPGWSNGRFSRLRVVGDTRAGGTVHRFAGDPELIERIDARMRGLTVRYVHVVRNPYDNVSTMTVRRGRALEQAVGGYFADCETLVRLRATIGAERLLTMRHEDLIADPRAQLADACRFVGIDASPEYLDACAGILFSNPSRTRESVDWPPELVDRVARDIERFDFLAGYSFES
jgi:Sulfotransferase family